MTYNKQKPNSLEIMEQFYKAQADIKAMNSELVRVRNKMNTKLAILNSINTYTASLENSMLKAGDKSSNYRIIFAHNTDKLVGGRFDSYGQTIHAKFVH